MPTKPYVLWFSVWHSEISLAHMPRVPFDTRGKGLRSRLNHLGWQSSDLQKKAGGIWFVPAVASCAVPSWMAAMCCCWRLEEGVGP